MENAFRNEMGKAIIMLKEKNEKLKSLLMKKQEEITVLSRFLVTEMCPHCGKENTIEWNVKKFGYKAYCPACGQCLMLCGECGADGCGYSHETDLCRRVVEKMWDELEDVPFDEDDEKEMYLSCDLDLEGTFFSKGTTRNEMWGWFNKNHPRGVQYLLYEYEKED